MKSWKSFSKKKKIISTLIVTVLVLFCCICSLSMNYASNKNGNTSISSTTISFSSSNQSSNFSESSSVKSIVVGESDIDNISNSTGGNILGIDTFQSTNSKSSVNLTSTINNYIVSRVIDGDTIEVLSGDNKSTIRIIGIDTPETVKPNTPVQCYGPESSAKAKVLLQGVNVILTSDSTQGDKDKYGRLLRYVSFGEGMDFGKIMIQDGFAREYTYDKAYNLQQSYKNLQLNAKNNFLGLWSKSTCNGTTEKVSDSTTITTTQQPSVKSSKTNTQNINITSTQVIITSIQTQLNIVPQVPVTSEQATAKTIQNKIDPPVAPLGKYTCNCSKTCSMIPIQMSCDEAQYQLHNCGCTVRDADNDGHACDAQCV